MTHILCAGDPNVSHLLSSTCPKLHWTCPCSPQKALQRCQAEPPSCEPKGRQRASLTCSECSGLEGQLYLCC